MDELARDLEGKVQLGIPSREDYEPDDMPLTDSVGLHTFVYNMHELESDDESHECLDPDYQDDQNTDEEEESERSLDACKA